jgi:hypothetical protein
MKNVILKIVVLMLLSTISNVFAEPSKAIKFLMTEETTLFDRGMDKLESEFYGMEIKPIGYFLTSVKYDWDENRIIISTTTSPNSQEAKDKSEAKTWCETTIKHMKLILGVSGSTGESLHEYSHINQYFSHYGYMNNRKTGGPGKELDRITDLKASIRYGDKESFDPFASCEGKLTDSKINFTQ